MPRGQIRSSTSTGNPTTDSRYTMHNSLAAQAQAEYSRYSRKTNRIKRKKKQQLETDTTVVFSHVIINTLTFGERLETDPTCVGVTSRAGHVVTTRSMLNGCMATWAFLDVVNPHPHLEQTVPSCSAVRAAAAFLVLNVARRAYARKARGA